MQRVLKRLGRYRGDACTRYGSRFPVFAARAAWGRTYSGLYSALSDPAVATLGTRCAPGTVSLNMSLKPVAPASASRMAEPMANRMGEPKT